MSGMIFEILRIKCEKAGGWLGEGNHGWQKDKVSYRGDFQ